MVLPQDSIPENFRELVIGAYSAESIDQEIAGSVSLRDSLSSTVFFPRRTGSAPPSTGVLLDRIFSGGEVRRTPTQQGELGYRDIAEAADEISANGGEPDTVVVNPKLGHLMLGRNEVVAAHHLTPLKPQTRHYLGFTGTLDVYTTVSIPVGRALVLEKSLLSVIKSPLVVDVQKDERLRSFVVLRNRIAVGLMDGRTVAAIS